MVDRLEKFEIHVFPYVGGVMITWEDVPGAVQYTAELHVARSLTKSYPMGAETQETQMQDWILESESVGRNTHRAIFDKLVPISSFITSDKNGNRQKLSYRVRVLAEGYDGAVLADSGVYNVGNVGNISKID